MNLRLKTMPEALGGGTVVAAVGLAQILATGALSVTPLGVSAIAFGVVAAFITATLGGLCATLISRTPGEVSGPRTSIAVIYAALCADLIARGGPGLTMGEIMATLSLAVVLMGALQIVAGLARLGDAMKFLPYPVTAGFVTGVGILIVWSQVGPLLGLEARLSSYPLPELFERFRPLALLIGLVTAAIVWLMPRITKKFQPLLAGLALGTALYYCVGLFAAPDSAGPTLGAIVPLATAQRSFTQAWSSVNPSWLIQTSVHVLPYAGFLALQGIMNSALSSAAIADITGVPQNLNRGLIAQGVANVFCGALAALPIGVSTSQAVVAARMRGINTVVPTISCIVLLVGVLAFGPFLAHTPVVVLAGLILTVGMGLIDRWTRGLVLRVVRRGTTQREVKWNLVIVAAVTGAFFFGSVPLALLVGTVLAMILLAISFSSATTFLSRPGSQVSSTRVWPPEQAAWLVGARSSIRVLRPHGGLFFGTAEQLNAQLATLKDGVRYCVIDCSGLTVLDATGCRIVASGARKLAARGVVTLLAGLDAAQPRDAALVDLGLVAPSAKTHWFVDLDHALEWVESELLHEHWPDVATDEPIDLGATSVARGLTDTELQVLRSRLKMVDLEAGKVLFESGATGRATYVVGSGLIEIRQQAGAAGGRARRLAVFGPGGVFGEIAMLTGHPRTADAVSVKATRVHELGQDAFSALERDHPGIFAKIVSNLNLHLATRLMVATDSRQAR